MFESEIHKVSHIQGPDSCLSHGLFFYCTASENLTAGVEEKYATFVTVKSYK